MIANPQTSERQVRARLEHDIRINLHRYPVRIELGSDGTLLLEGEVESVTAKKLALKLAAGVPGVAGIVDRLRVVPLATMGDGELRDRVVLDLSQEPAFGNIDVGIHGNGRQPASDMDFIEIAVEKGRVILSGRVKSLSHQRLAGVVAWWVAGTRDVVNTIEVVPEQEDSDEEVAEALKLVLERDPLTTGVAIRARVSDSTVVLEGMVANEGERRAAETDAWCVLGVNDVINHLELA